jgi:hypothetical protein
MRHLWLFLILLSSAAALAKRPKREAPAAAPAAAPATTGGALQINCTTQGAEIWVDGEKAGTVPLAEPLPFSPGDHTIKVIKPGFAPFIDVFKIDKRKNTQLDIELVPISGVLKVSANVEQANVFIDGKFVGQAPLTVDMGVGAKAIQVSKGGYKDFFQNVESVAGQEMSIQVSLEELPAGANPYKVAAAPPPKWYEKWWVWTAAAGGVAVLVTAIVVPITVSGGNPVNDFHAAYTFSINNK